jgi:hypothetical protein
MFFENLTVGRLIIHEVHRRLDDRQPVLPTYGQQILSLSPEAMDFFRERIVAAMGSNSQSMQMSIAPVLPGCAVEIARDLLAADDAAFVVQSRRYPDKLTSVQTGRNIPGGVVVVFTGAAGTHDTIYKPKVDATSKMKRTAAKSMALIEATNDYFQQVVDQVAEFIQPSKNLTEKLSEVYRTFVGREPELSRAEGLILDSYELDAGDDISTRLDLFLKGNTQLAVSIAEKASRKLLFRQPSILIIYLLVSEKPNTTKEQWPLTPDELKPIYVDLGKAFESY